MVGICIASELSLLFCPIFYTLWKIKNELNVWIGILNYNVNEKAKAYSDLPEMSFLWNRRWTFSSYFHDGSQWALRLLQQFHDFASHLVDSPQSVVHVCKHSFRSHFYLTIKRASSFSKVLWASGLFGFAARHLITEQTSSLELRRSFILACWLPYWEI